MNHSIKDLRKAAILLVSLSDQTASRILEHLDRPTAKKLSAEIRALGEIRQEDRNQAVADFLQELLGADYKSAGNIIRRWSNSRIEITFPRFTIDSEE